MTFNFKSALLAGTALVAAAAFAPAAQAADITLTNNAVWGTLGFGMVATPTAGDNVIMGINNLQFDTTETGVLTAGAITATDGQLLVDTTGNAGNVAFTIGSFTTSAGGLSSLVVDNLNAASDRNVALTVTGAVTTGDSVFIRNLENSDSSNSTTMTVGGNFTVGGAGTTTVSTNGAGQTGVTALLDLNGATNTFAGAVTVTGGAADATNTASLNIAGNSTFTGGLTLTNGAVGHAILTLDGLTTAQTVTGTVGGTGDIVVQNAAGVTFNGAVTSGSIVIENGGAALNSSATFKDNVNSVMTLGGAGTGTNTITFDATTVSLGVTGAINGAAGGETNNVVVTSSAGVARVVTQATAIGGGAGNVDNLTVSGTDLTFDSNANIAVTDTVTIGSGATLDNGAGALSATTIANSGTLLLSGAGGVAGNITGTGLLDVNASVGVNGAITQGTADIAAFTLTQSGGTNAYNVGSTNFSGAGTLVLAAGNKAVTGNFTNTTDGQGTITLANGAGTTAITGNVGASTAHSLAAFDFQNAGPTAQTVTTTGNWFVDATRLDASDELAFIGTSAQTVSGTVAGHGAGEGLLTIGNGVAASDVTFNGIVGLLNSASINAGATARYNASATFSTSYSQNATGKTYVGQGSTITADSFSNAGTYYLNVVDADGTLATGDFGHLEDSSNNGALTASGLNINLTGDVGTGTVRLLTGINAGAATLTDNSIQYSFVTADNTTHTDVTVARTSAATLAAGTNNVAAATVLDSLNASTDVQIAAVVDSLAAATTQAQFNEIVESVGPTVDGGAVTGGFNASVQSIDVNNTRLAALNNGETGMVAGEMGNGLAAWTQGFGQTADQDRRDNIDGYESDTYGVAVGIDTANAVEGGTLGMALSYANTDVDSKNANRTNSDVDSYQVSLYGDYDVAPNTYVSGTVAYAYNDIDQARFNVGGVAGQTARAEYDSNQYIAYGEVGHKFQVADKTFITPHALAHYQHISIDDYLETGAGGLNLNVDNDDMDIFELGIGAEIAWELEGDGSKIRPALEIGYRHDLVGDEVASTSNFTGGGATFKTDGVDPANGTFNVGASLGYALDNDWDFTASYDYEAKSDYDAHSAFVRAKYKY